MADLQETGQWESGIYQWETSDPVEGGPSGIDNVPTRQLANRTAYLKKHLDELENGTVAAGKANKLSIARRIAMIGDASFSVNFDGSANVSATLTLANTGVAAGTYPKVTVDAKGRVTGGASLAATDIPALDWAKITTGKPTTVAGYGITDIAATVPNASESVQGKVELATKAETVAGASTSLAVHPAGVAAAIAALVASSPAALDTLNELAAALGNDPNFATTMTNLLALKAPLSSPALTDLPTAPTAALGTNTKQIANMAALQASAATRVMQLRTGAALPVSNVGPIWHDDYGSLMTWQTFNANGANYVGYASVLVGNLLQDTQPTSRTGYIKSGTQNLSRTTYAALRAWAMHNGLMVALGKWVAGALMVADNADGTTFRIYDVRGEFPRFWDDGRGVDAGRAFGSAQGDAIRNIEASLTAFTINGGGGVVMPSYTTGALRAYDSGSNVAAVSSTGGAASNYGLSFDASRVVPTASENRSRNSALAAQVKF